MILKNYERGQQKNKSDKGLVLSALIFYVIVHGIYTIGWSERYRRVPLELNRIEA